MTAKELSDELGLPVKTGRRYRLEALDYIRKYGTQAWDSEVSTLSEAIQLEYLNTPDPVTRIECGMYIRYDEYMSLLDTGNPTVLSCGPVERFGKAVCDPRGNPYYRRMVPDGCSI